LPAAFGRGSVADGRHRIAATTTTAARMATTQRL
jgi:hypothetical protein